MRILGVDLARGVALLAMFVAHTAPLTRESPFPLKLLTFSDHFAMPLFAVMIGVSAGLASRNALADGQRASQSRFRNGFAIRGLLLIALGILAGFFGAQVYPILHYCGAVCLLLLPFLFVRARWLAGATVAAAVVSSALMPIIADGTLALWSMHGALLPRLLTMVAGFFFFDPAYRVTSVLAFALVGLAIARTGFRTRAMLTTGAAGAALLAAGFVSASLFGVAVSPHSGTLPELSVSTGWALIVLAVCALTGEIAARPGSTLGRALSPVAALGSMTLTFYIAQLAVLGVWTRFFSPSDDHWWMLALLSGGSLAGAVLFRRFLGGGPLERMVAVIAYGGRRARPA
ncbi:hypothetical protein O159_24250 [Leifsonia xyli subsp. cynodontis DSM 46306]|uniref:Acyltransferase 3 domain-containing protein n=1 Tax=Leifsonia xyli subsp. cynodontis DSM 46306 TaxID=1389489 RepID=U3PCB0_LEIXC|nr:acyltransferase family protein [Leifsonia xyli]AGW42372.1 hypothetical protein O159_24250 [Leifsonia xyli subsp. cynodontis DSM 46306]